MKRYKQIELSDIANQCAFSIKNSIVDGNLSSEPFKHIVIDNFLPVDVTKGLLSAFPPPDDNSWDRTDDAGIEIKAR